MCVHVCTAGSVVVNDLIFQAATPYLPFGGVGHSGTGAYHGGYVNALSVCLSVFISLGLLNFL